MYHAALATVDYQVKMSRTLLLLRHAKAAAYSESGTDYDRPLAKRGVRDAEAIAHVLRSERLKPDLVLCSSALRTRQTLVPILALWPDLDIRYEDSLYLASVEEGLSYVKRADKAQRTLLLAHNPMTENILHTLVNRQANNDLAGLADAMTKYPTGALAELSLDIDNWADLSPSCGTLRRFVKPRTLAGERV